MMVLIDYGKNCSKGLITSVYFSSGASCWWKSLHQKLSEEEAFEWDEQVFLKYMKKDHCLIPVEFIKVATS